MRYIALALLMFTGCQPANELKLAPVTHVCPQLETFSPAEQNEIADDLVAIPRDRPIHRAFREYEYLRDVARDCAGKPDTNARLYDEKMSRHYCGENGSVDWDPSEKFPPPHCG